jgi:hypothetical protein
MTAEERSRLELLDQIVRSNEDKIQPVVDRVRAELARNSEAVMAWEPIPLETFGRGLPQGIRSGWIFILRAGADTGPERHPNSNQRMMTLLGTGDMRVRAGLALTWQSNFLISDPDAPLERRWISIPANTWHRPVVGKDAHWVVVSFHTVLAEELIEEKPDSDRGRGTRRKKYVGSGEGREEKS